MSQKTLLIYYLMYYYHSFSFSSLIFIRIIPLSVLTQFKSITSINYLNLISRNSLLSIYSIKMSQKTLLIYFLTYHYHSNRI